MKVEKDKLQEKLLLNSKKVLKNLRISTFYCNFAPNLYDVMKTKVFLACVLMSVGLLVSCREEPSEADMKSYIAAVSLYYPYSLDEDWVFINDRTGDKWEAYAYDFYNEGKYPYTHITICPHEVGSKCSGDKSGEIIAWMVEKGVPVTLDEPSSITTTFNNVGGQKEVGVEWHVSLRMSTGVLYSGSMSNTYPYTAVLSQLTDTLEIPLSHMRPQGESNQPASKGAYARIVKNQGLTEFSVDGETTWRREMTMQY